MHRSPRSVNNITGGVVHVNVGPEIPNHGDTDLVNYLNNNGPEGGGYHWVFDNNSGTRCAEDNQLVYGAPYMNETGIHYCLIGQASQSREEWLDAYSRGELTGLAKQVAADAKKYGWDIRRLSIAEVRLYRKGLLGHVDVTNAFKYKDSRLDHWDPGPNFPWDEFLRLVNFFHSGAAPAPASTPQEAMMAGMTIGLNRKDPKSSKEQFVRIWPEHGGLLLYNGARLAGDTGPTPFGNWRWWNLDKNGKATSVAGKPIGGELSKDEKFVQVMFDDGGVFNYPIAS